MLHYSDNDSEFVNLCEEVPDIITEIRYYTTFNFTGRRVSGYLEPAALLTRAAAEALKHASDEAVKSGYRLKVFDAYRPQEAVDNFVRWASDPDDIRMKEYFYPSLDKQSLIPDGYIAEHSSHSRGSTVDLTLFDMKNGKEADMGGQFDLFSCISHSDCSEVTFEQSACRLLLRGIMEGAGFLGIPEEWWHFTLRNEPFPDTYFTFPVRKLTDRRTLEIR